jgi:hypothetical protein
LNVSASIIDVNTGNTSTCGEAIVDPAIGLFISNVTFPNDCTETSTVGSLWAFASACCSNHVANTACGGPEVQSVCQDPSNFIPDGFITGPNVPCILSTELTAQALHGGCDADLTNSIALAAEFCCIGGASTRNRVCEGTFC